jgi:hypothetical protein
VYDVAIFQGNDPKDATTHLRYRTPEAVTTIGLSLDTQWSLHHPHTPGALQVRTFPQHHALEICRETVS